MHGFAIGQSEQPALDLPPGQMVETVLTFDKPGRYIFYCTRWCGSGHWRMRGMIEVTGETAAPVAQTPPLYLTLGLDLDSPHPADIIPAEKPSALRGANLGVTLYTSYQTLEYYRAHSPAQTWQALRAAPVNRTWSNAEVWDVVAFLWQSHTTLEARLEGQQLYAQNCAACHGENGAGDGVFAQGNWGTSSNTQPPANFTNATQMLGASPALLQGKIIRGGMGTGMPYWGPIFTEAQTWALVDYLWTFQFEEQP
jgi:mono/diheme cytochrome c family protein